MTRTPEQEHTKILSFLISNPGYLKKGRNFLAKRFNCSPAIAQHLRSEARKARRNIKKTHIEKEVEIKQIEKPLEIIMPKILLVDIETAPIKSFVWRLWKQSVLPHQVISEWFMLTWAAKWLNHTDILSNKLTAEEVLTEDDKRITMNLWKLLDEADIIIAHNGNQFDVPKMKSRFIIHGLPPTSFYHTIDTKQVASKEFGFSSNKLDSLAGYFGFKTKDSTTFELWVNCLKGDEDALQYMETYNRHDVILLEKVYKKLLPYIKNHPNVLLYDEVCPSGCPSCGKGILTNNGYYYTTVNKYPLYRCNNCGALARSRRAEKRINTLEVTSVSGKF